MSETSYLLSKNDILPGNDPVGKKINNLIQSIKATGGTIIFDKPGTYYLEEPILLPKTPNSYWRVPTNTIRLKGVGRNQIAIKAHPSFLGDEKNPRALIEWEDYILDILGFSKVEGDPNKSWIHIRPVKDVVGGNCHWELRHSNIEEVVLTDKGIDQKNSNYWKVKIHKKYTDSMANIQGKVNYPCRAIDQEISGLSFHLSNKAAYGIRWKLVHEDFNEADYVFKHVEGQRLEIRCTDLFFYMNPPFSRASFKLGGSVLNSHFEDILINHTPHKNWIKMHYDKMSDNPLISQSQLEEGEIYYEDVFAFDCDHRVPPSMGKGTSWHTPAHLDIAGDYSGLQYSTITNLRSCFPAFRGRLSQSSLDCNPVFGGFNTAAIHLINSTDFKLSTSMEGYAEKAQILIENSQHGDIGHIRIATMEGYPIPYTPITLQLPSSDTNSSDSEVINAFGEPTPSNHSMDTVPIADRFVIPPKGDGIVLKNCHSMYIHDRSVTNRAPDHRILDSHKNGRFIKVDKHCDDITIERFDFAMFKDIEHMKKAIEIEPKAKNISISGKLRSFNGPVVPYKIVQE